MKKILFFAGLFLFLSMLPIQSYNCEAKTVKTQKEVIKAGGYTLKCGRYKGYETYYDYENKKVKTKEVFATLTKNEIIINGISTQYSIMDNKLYVNNRVMYEIIGNNKLLMLAGGGIIFKYE